MVSVTASFAILWAPHFAVMWSQALVPLTFASQNMSLVLYYASLFLGFFNICTNPFIYAAKHDKIRAQLVRWFCLRRKLVTPAVSLSLSVTATHASIVRPTIGTRIHVTTAEAQT